MCSSMLLTMLVFTLLLASSALALPNPRNRLSKRAVTPIYNGAEVADRTFDYVVVGGGLSGSVLASRLSEEGGKSVLLIEAGYDEEGREEVTDAGQYQSTFDVRRGWGVLNDRHGLIGSIPSYLSLGLRVITSGARCVLVVDLEGVRSSMGWHGASLMISSWTLCRSSGTRVSTGPPCSLMCVVVEFADIRCSRLNSTLLHRMPSLQQA